MTFYFIDVSRYSGTINYAAVKATGIKGVVCKATEGTVSQTAQVTAEYFVSAASAIQRVGFPIRGGYHWLRPGNYADQARNFRDSLVRGFGSLDGLVVQLDAEGSGVTIADVQGFMGAWNKLTGSYPIVGYFPRWYWAGQGVGANRLLHLVNGLWWQSAYVPGVGDYRMLAGRVAGEFAPWDGLLPLVLQFTDSAQVPGVVGPCDTNMVKGTVTNFLGVATRVPKPPEPPPVVPRRDDVVKLIMGRGDNAVFLAGVAPSGKYRIYVQASEFPDLVLCYGQPIVVDDVNHFGPLVTAS